MQTYFSLFQSGHACVFAEHRWLTCCRPHHGVPQNRPRKSLDMAKPGLLLHKTWACEELSFIVACCSINQAYTHIHTNICTHIHTYMHAYIGIHTMRTCTNTCVRKHVPNIHIRRMCAPVSLGKNACKYAPGALACTMHCPTASPLSRAYKSCRPGARPACP